jgi:hypothetical protein
MSEQREPSGASFPAAVWPPYTNKEVKDMELEYKEPSRSEVIERKKWCKTNGYKYLNFASCLECAFFKINPSFHQTGYCGLMKKDGVYNMVMAQAVCNQYVL